MAELDEKVKTFIVIGLARRKTPSTIVLDVKEWFDLDISRQQVRSYNPEQCDNVAQKWVDLFNQERKAFLEDVKLIPISHESYRLQLIQTVVDRNPKNSDLILRAAEQAAKERGGAYTNKRNVNINPREALADLLGVPVEDLPEESKT